MKKNLLINIDDVSGIKADKESHAKEIWRRLYADSRHFRFGCVICRCYSTI